MGWNFDGDCIESVDCFWQDGHFYYINPDNPWAWKIIPSSEISDFFLQRLEVFGNLRSCTTNMNNIDPTRASSFWSQHISIKAMVLFLLSFLFLIFKYHWFLNTVMCCEAIRDNRKVQHMALETLRRHWTTKELIIAHIGKQCYSESKGTMLCKWSGGI